MLKHNFLISLRSFRRFKITFFINLIGLASGLTSAILIYLWVADELKVDGFHKYDTTLYQVMQNYVRAEGTSTGLLTPVPLAASFLSELPEVEKSVAIIRGADGVASVGDTHIKSNVLLAGDQFFELFSFPLHQGNRNKVFTNTQSVAISTDLAQSLFGTMENVIGKSIKLKHFSYNGLLEVSAIFQKPPLNSTLQFDLVVDIELYTSANEWIIDWNGDEAETFVLLAEETSVEVLNNKISGWLKSKEPEDRKDSQLFLHKFSDLYLYGEYEAGIPVAGRASYVGLFTFVAIFIVLIACINFVNLSTAQAAHKMKEIGIKKAMGVDRGSLILQLLTETIAISLLAMMVALLSVILLLPEFNELVSKNLVLQPSIVNVLLILSLTLVVGIIAGSYPAFYLSGFKPVSVLKGSILSSNLRKSFSETLVRKSLVIFQFTISLIFIMIFIVINQQLTFVQTTDIGYDRDDLITFKMKAGYGYMPNTFITALEKIPGVISATNLTQGSIVANPGRGGGFTWEGQTPEQEFLSYGRPQVGAGFVETLGLTLLEGRAFSNEFSNESDKLMINQSTADLMGKENVVGTIVMDSGQPKEIIGIVGDFNINSLRETILPTFIRYFANGATVMLKLSDGREQETIAKISDYYNEIHPDFPFEFEFVDQQYSRLYQEESRVAQLSTYFTSIAIIVSCLGIFGLASFTVRKRNKEIAIRKLHGSSTGAIVFQLSAEFIKVISIAIIIGIPTSYYALQGWLEGFAYRIGLTPQHFIVASAFMFLIAWITILTQTTKSARINVADSLRNE